MSQQKEGRFKQKAVKDLKEAFGDDIFIIVTQERGRKGVADLVFCLRGQSVHNELKLDGQKPTKLQQLRLDQHAKAGGLSMASTPENWPMHFSLLKARFGNKP